MAERVLNFSEFAGKYSQDSKDDSSASSDYVEFSKTSDRFSDAFDDSTYDQPQLGPKRPVSGSATPSPAQPGEEGAPSFTSSPSDDMKFGGMATDNFQSFSGSSDYKSSDDGVEYPDIESEEEEGEAEPEEGETETPAEQSEPTNWDEDGGNPEEEEGEEPAEEGEEEEGEEGEEEEGEEEEEEEEEAAEGEEEEEEEKPNESRYWKNYNTRLILESFLEREENELVDEEEWDEDEDDEEEWGEEGEEGEEMSNEDLYNLIIGSDSSTKTRPTIAPPPTETPTRPWRPVPTKRPGEKEKSKPMADFNFDDEESEDMNSFVKCKSCGEKKMIELESNPFEDSWWNGHELGMQCGCNM
jgi:hypothetical protein